jgi:hypothetical protein
MNTCLNGIIITDRSEERELRLSSIHHTGGLINLRTVLASYTTQLMGNSKVHICFFFTNPVTNGVYLS